jgi:SAM-dependent methyltransferase
MDLDRHLEQWGPAGTEAAYERLVGYGFVRRYVGGKVVADVGRDGLGLGSRLLADTARSVVGLARSDEALELAATAYPAPNVEYEKAEPAHLPYPDDHFDVVVAFGVAEKLENPDDLLREADRVLKPGGMLIISATDKGARPGEGSGMYVPEFLELLERRFQGVRLYRMGAGSGGVVFPLSGEISGTPVESVRASVTGPYPGAEPPPTRSVMAVCGDAKTLEREEPPYLLLDRDRRIFDECEDRTEDVELLREEIRRMQETEVRAFQDSLRLHMTEISHLRAQVRRARTQELALRTMRNQLRAMENSTTWRLFEPYRRLMGRIDAARRARVDKKDSGGDRPI